MGFAVAALRFCVVIPLSLKSHRYCMAVKHQHELISTVLPRRPADQF